MCTHEYPIDKTYSKKIIEQLLAKNWIKDAYHSTAPLSQDNTKCSFEITLTSHSELYSSPAKIFKEL